MPLERTWSRRALLKGALVGATWSAWPAVGRASEADDLFLAAARAGLRKGWSPLRSLLYALPELQLQPRPGDLVGREALARLLEADLIAQASSAPLALFSPFVVRLPAWLAVAVSLELFELQLENGPLPAFELTGVAREHVQPFTALIDQALRPVCELLRRPDRVFDAEQEAVMTDFLLQLRGRLVLLGDETLIATAERLRQGLGQGVQPLLLRVLAEEDRASETLEAVFAFDEDNGVLNWRFRADGHGWAAPSQNAARAVDKLITAALIGKLFQRCPLN